MNNTIRFLKYYFLRYIYFPVLTWLGLAKRVEGISGIKEMLGNLWLSEGIKYPLQKLGEELFLIKTYLKNGLGI